MLNLLCQTDPFSVVVFILTGRSVVWLARLLWEQEAVSSNLTVPTISDCNHSLYFPNEIR